jgi:hypothetical protein
VVHGFLIDDRIGQGVVIKLGWARRKTDLSIVNLLRRRGVNALVEAKSVA